MTASKPEASEPKAPNGSAVALPTAALPAFPRARIGAAAAGVGLTLLLAACGGGGGGGGGDDPPPPAEVVCVSQNAASDTGFALGICPSPQSVVFQDVVTTVDVVAAPRQYTLNLAFPANQPASLGGTYTFTVPNNKTAFGARDVIGGLRGEAFEDPRAPQGPFTALTSFHKYWDNLSAPEGSHAHEFTHIDFGVWERFGSETSDGYFGTWYTGWDAGAVHDWPVAARVYTGHAVGVLSPHRASGDTHADRQAVTTYGFSAIVSIAVDSQGRIIENQSTLTDFVVSFPDPIDPQNSSKVETIAIGPLSFRQDSGGASPAAVTGNLALTDGGPSAFEAEFFGAAAAPATEIAGRFRLKTAAGLFAIGSFGAFAQ